MAAANVIEVTDASFDSAVLKSDLPVIVDFWAPWCGPCKQIAPLLDELATKYAGKVVVAKVNVDSNPKVAASLGISGIPTLLTYKGGNMVGRVVGAPARPKMEELFRSLA
jgi:thioredoxin 1